MSSFTYAGHFLAQSPKKRYDLPYLNACIFCFSPDVILLHRSRLCSLSCHSGAQSSVLYSPSCIQKWFFPTLALLWSQFSTRCLTSKSGAPLTGNLFTSRVSCLNGEYGMPEISTSNRIGYRLVCHHVPSELQYTKFRTTPYLQQRSLALPQCVQTSPLPQVSRQVG